MPASNASTAASAEETSSAPENIPADEEKFSCEDSTLPRRFLPPGFRRGNPWFGLIAVFGYFLIFAASLNLQEKDVLYMSG